MSENDYTPELPVEIWESMCRARLKALTDAAESRKERNAYVVACLRRGVRPAPIPPAEGFIIAETPEMYRG